MYYIIFFLLQAILSINNPHPDIFIVIRIDKILQGNVHQVSEPYVKAAKDPRLGLKVHKSVKSYAARLGSYRMPFAWAAKPLFRYIIFKLITIYFFYVISLFFLFFTDYIVMN